MSNEKAPCKVCGQFKRQYGQMICRACYRINRAKRLAEYRAKVLGDPRPPH